LREKRDHVVSIGKCECHDDCGDDDKGEIKGRVLIIRGSMQIINAVSSKLMMFGLANDVVHLMLQDHRSRADPTLLNDFEMAAEGNGDLPVPDL
nr:hypothetical protein [Tanacetum cinerariifolium]